MKKLAGQEKIKRGKVQRLRALVSVTAFLLCVGCNRPQNNRAAAETDPASGTVSAAAAETQSGTSGKVLHRAGSAHDGHPSSSPEATASAEAASQTADSGARKHEPEPYASAKYESEEYELEERLQSMTLEEKAAQLFIILPESLVESTGPVTAAGELTRNAFQNIPVGGFIYLGSNLESAEQVKAMLSHVQDISMERLNLPAFLSVDEEGGRVARIGGSGRFDVPVIGSMSEIGESGDKDRAYRTGAEIGAYLSALGFNLDFAPIADVLSNPDNTVVKGRSFGSDPENVSALALSVANGLHDQGVLSVYKHFPGHGATAGDTHDGYAFTEKTIEELQSCELIPFRDGIRAGIPFIMVGHFSLPQVTGDSLPASLSPAVITGLLREEMGFDGIVITDALNMGAIAQQYSSAEAAILALKAGNDILLMPADFKSAYQGVLDAVARGELTTERIDESVRRILRIKLAG